MPLNFPVPGPNSLNEYQVSAIPWVSSSTGTGLMGFTFPFVTMFIVIKNTSTGSNSINVGFTANGVQNNNQFTLAPGESFSGEFRLLQVFTSASLPYSVSIVAGLTGIPANMFPALTASNGWQGVG